MVPTITSSVFWVPFDTPGLPVIRLEKMFRFDSFVVHQQSNHVGISRGGRVKNSNLHGIRNLLSSHLVQ
jgi:hypothetical protein